MSYSFDCITDLTLMQRGVMYLYVLRRFFTNNPSTFYSNEDLDNYENDNYWKPGSAFSSTNNQILINENQEHTFHKSPSTAISSCDTDWMWFNVPQTRDYSIKTSLVTGTTAANTELKLYSINSAGALTFITSDDNSGGNGFSLIYRVLASGNYAVEVINKNPSIVSDYNISVSDFCNDFVNGTYLIGDQSFLCATNKSFALQNHYPGSTIVWSQSSNVVTVSGQGTTSYTVKASSTGGNGWLKVTMSKSGCPDMVTPTETFWVGKPNIDGTYNNGQPVGFRPYPPAPGDDGPPYYNPVCNGVYTTLNLQPSGSNSGYWQRVAANPTNTSWSPSGYNASFYFWAVNQTMTLRYTTSNECGTSANDYSFISIDCSGGGGDPCNQYSVSPNPSSTTINIIAPNIPAPCDSYVQSSDQTVESNLTIQSVSVTGANGQIKQSRKFLANTKQAELDVSGLQRGVYILKISDGTYTETHRIIKN